MWPSDLKVTGRTPKIHISVNRLWKFFAQRLSLLLKVRADLLQIGAAFVIINWGIIITNWGSYCKLRQIFYKLEQILQIDAQQMALFNWGWSCQRKNLPLIISLNLFVPETRIPKWTMPTEQSSLRRWSDTAHCLTSLRRFLVKLEIPCSAITVRILIKNVGVAPFLNKALIWYSN